MDLGRGRWTRSVLVGAALVGTLVSVAYGDNLSRFLKKVAKPKPKAPAAAPRRAPRPATGLAPKAEPPPAAAPQSATPQRRWRRESPCQKRQLLSRRGLVSAYRRTPRRRAPASRARRRRPAGTAIARTRLRPRGRAPTRRDRRRGPESVSRSRRSP